MVPRIRIFNPEPEEMYADGFVSFINMTGLPNALCGLTRMEARAAKTGKPAVLTEFAVYNLERNNHFDCSKAKNELGFAPRPYKETLHDLAVWLKQEGKIA